MVYRVIGAHGGAGAGTVADLLRLAGADARVVDAAKADDAPAPYDRVRATPVPVVVARSTAAGLVRAAKVLTGWDLRQGAPWLVVVADLPAPPPAVVRYRIQAVAGRCAGVVTVPYFWPLRAVASLDELADPGSLRPAAARLRAALERAGRRR
ncbi:MAG: hypothetical protein ACT4PP_05375 [Sporichthyaceae bacterium]